jgi:hypothetical protein
MSVKIPDHFTFGLDVDVGLGLSGGIGITSLPKINIGLDPITINPIKIELAPIELGIRIKELPSMRVHLPVDYRVCVGLFGAELLSMRLCGQAQVITEPYVPNPCECRPTAKLTDQVLKAVE